ncbi:MULTISPECIES: PASTA domain-containing protein [unclassified Streptomyces]|uniref:PASTA domain-containing protein n=1 Tax=unclassified Streptomyces TaxID=2593676 RepID=UPI00203630D3|nr:MULTISPECIES: PASTA domain-containing protein [unclassified Streptomyces]
MRRIAVLLVLVLALAGCDRDAPLFVVKAVAAGVPSLAPFFDESQGLGQDARIRAQTVHGGLQQGDTPGLYGGSKQPTICDVVRLKEFLTDPAHERKAQAWAAALSIDTAGIPDYLDRLTPVLLRHDTLVQNHDYKTGKAVPFNALLQAGIAILVDAEGLPAVKCSCGNPLRPFEGDTTRIKVEFDDRNEEWQGYEKSSVVAVRPAARAVERLALVDVEEPDRGIHRPVGTTGEDDTAFDTRERRAVPDLAGTTFGQASRKLAGEGLAVALEGGGLPPDDARVMASDPPAGTELRFGEYVTLSVAGGTTSDGSSDGSAGAPSSGSSDAGTAPPEATTSPPTRDPSDSTPSDSTPSTSSPSASTPPPSSSGPGSSGPSSPDATSRPPSSGTSSSGPPPSSSPPPSTKDPTTSSPPPPVTGAPPPTTGSPPTTAPVTSSAPPPETSSPATSSPATTGPATGAPSTGEPTASTTA